MENIPWAEVTLLGAGIARAGEGGGELRPAAPHELVEKALRCLAWPWTLKSLWHRPVYLIRDPPYKIYRVAWY